jgi:hypothetical protein
MMWRRVSVMTAGRLSGGDAAECAEPGPRRQPGHPYAGQALLQIAAAGKRGNLPQTRWHPSRSQGSIFGQPCRKNRQTPMNNRPFILRPTLRAMSARSLLAWKTGTQAHLALTGGEASRPAPLGGDGGSNPAASPLSPASALPPARPV